MTLNNSTVIWQGEQPLVVEQGPRWLADLIYGPPSWLMWTLGLLGLALCAYIVWTMATREEILDEETLLDMSQNVLVLVVTGGVMVLLTDAASFPYLVDVAIGAGLGWVGGLAGRQALSVLVVPRLALEQT